MSQPYTLYLPKKYRNSANVAKYIYDVLIHFDPLLKDDIAPSMGKDWFNGLVKTEVGQKVLNEIKTRVGNIPDGFVYVDYYDGFLVFFDSKKATQAMEKYLLTEKNIHAHIQKVVIADIDEIKAAPIDTEIHKPCGNDNFDDYPAVYYVNPQ